ncbi:MAG: hypothetical protein WC737_03515 [Parcubacteria group bacterium]
MKKTIFIIAFLYCVFMFSYLSSKYLLEDQAQCGRCVRVCQVTCLDKNPCSFAGYVKTYFMSAFSGCKKYFKINIKSI